MPVKITHQCQRPQALIVERMPQIRAFWLLKMLCRLFVDVHRNALPFSEPAGGRALRKFVYAGLEYVDGKLALRNRTTEKSIEHAFARLKAELLRC